MKTFARTAALAIVTALVASAPPALGQTPPAQDSRAATSRRPEHTEADVRFMQGMIAHHAQALVMAELVPSRTTRQELHDLAERIHVSQQDEIEWIKQWLRDRGEAVPDSASMNHAHHGAAADTAMPGMLTPAEMDQLRNARGAAFDRLFLTFMIKHHEGALTMVRQLFGTPGAGQESYIFEFATDVDADQLMEIERMRAILRTIPPGTTSGTSR